MARASPLSSLKLLFPSSTTTISLKFLSSSSSFATFHAPPSTTKRREKPHHHHHHKNKPPKAAPPKAVATTTTASAKSKSKASAAALEVVKRRTRSEKEFDEDYIKKFGDKGSHIPVLLGEVLDVFSPSFRLCSFVDCTLGAAGHSSAIIHAHPEMQTFIGLDVDPVAHEKAQSRINDVLHCTSSSLKSDLKTHMFWKNFKDIKQALGQVEGELLTSGVDGILMDLGMSSMQVDDAGRGFSLLNNGPLDMRMNPTASLKAEDILNTWPTTEVGRVLREYGEESNWYFLQNKIVKAREGGGLHSTGDLVDLIRRTTSKTKGGRQGWIKTASRVFQALRIAVNDELKTLENSLYSCFDCLGPGGRLAVISFHSLEDRIVKQTFLDIIKSSQKQGEGVYFDEQVAEPREISDDNTVEKDAWIKQTVKGSTGIILTKRPITASTEEEKINPRCRSAKLRVIQKR